jgi:hypothetical protein
MKYILIKNSKILTQQTRDSWQIVGPDTLTNCRDQLARQSAKELVHGKSVTFYQLLANCLKIKIKGF